MLIAAINQQPRAGLGRGAMGDSCPVCHRSIGVHARLRKRARLSEA